jgi:DNA-binding CsgD family transcriptional regulator
MICPQCSYNSGPYQCLSQTQVKILELVAEGESNAEIAAKLGCTPSTVKQGISRAGHMFGVDGELWHVRVKLGWYWSCELFRLGCKELGLMPIPLEGKPCASSLPCSS